VGAVGEVVDRSGAAEVGEVDGEDGMVILR
jgi:hypothetical protein